MFEENLSLKDLNVEKLGLQIYKKINVVFHKVLIIAIQVSVIKMVFTNLSFWNGKVKLPKKLMRNHLLSK